MLVKFETNAMRSFVCDVSRLHIVSGYGAGYCSASNYSTRIIVMARRTMIFLCHIKLRILSIAHFVFSIYSGKVIPTR